MSYLKTDEVKVFPSTRRVNKQTSARLMTEQSMVRIINQLIDSEGFVITDTLPSTITSTDVLEFNIHGYYFLVNLESLLALGTSWDDIWGVITLDTTSEYVELSGQDSTDDQTPGENTVYIYEGIDFQDEFSPAENKYGLHLLTKTGSAWSIPSDSKIKFGENSLDIDIDGGIIPQESN